MKTTLIKLPGANDFFTQEAYKVLRTNLQFCGQDIKSIVITSCNENEGKSTITLHTAMSFAELDKKVLVIDADMRKSVMAGKNTTAKNVSGLSEVLTGMEKFEDCLYGTQCEGLHMMFAGKYPPNPVELLSGQYFEKLLEFVRTQYDYIFIDTPPLGQVIDAGVIAPLCDGTVLIMDDAKARYHQAQDVVTQIQKSGAKILGVVRNNTNKRNKAYYRREKYYGKRKYSSEPKKK